MRGDLVRGDLVRGDSAEPPGGTRYGRTGGRPYMIPGLGPRAVPPPPNGMVSYFSGVAALAFLMLFLGFLSFV